jgi:hypothetical protein
MPHPHMPPGPLPEPPDHVVPTAPDSREQRAGVIWCVRCGRAMQGLDGTPLVGASKPCQIVRVELR